MHGERGPALGAVLSLTMGLILAASLMAAWITAILSTWNHGRLPLLDVVCPPCGAVHGVLIWVGWAAW